LSSPSRGDLPGETDIRLKKPLPGRASPSGALVTGLSLKASGARFALAAGLRANRALDLTAALGQRPGVRLAFAAAVGAVVDQPEVL